jgi:hypothetical protein
MHEHLRDTRFNPEIQIHKESYVLVEGFIKNRVSLNPFLSQEVTKTDLELLAITKMGNTNFSRLSMQSGGSRATSNSLGAKLQE